MTQFRQIPGKSKYELSVAGASIHVGGRHEADDLFVPELHVLKDGWNGFGALRIRHSDAERAQGQKHRLVGGIGVGKDQTGIEWSLGGRTHHFIPGSVEHHITYVRREDAPADGIETYAIDFDGGALEWLYQSALTPEETAAGHERPAEICGSYAVYGTRAGNLVGPEGAPLASYETGKLCHIYRPKLVDANGQEIWCDLAYEDKKLSVAMPLDFLSSAAYPLALDPNFGYSSIGASTLSDPSVAYALKHAGYLYTAAAGDTLTNIYVYIKGLTGGSPNATYCTVALYTVSSGNPSALVASGTTTTAKAAGWHSWTLSQSLTNGMTYTLACGLYTTDCDHFTLYYDSGSSGDSCSRADSTLPNPWGTATNQGYRISLYGTYALSGTAVPIYHLTQLCAA